jgi:hypothetical protein
MIKGVEALNCFDKCGIFRSGQPKLFFLIKNWRWGRLGIENLHYLF